MSCDDNNHQTHMCALKRAGKNDLIKVLSDNPKVECRQCGVKANSAENLCAAHLGELAPNVEGGHGTVDLKDVGKPHEGSAGEDGEAQIAIKQISGDDVCGGY